VVSDSTILGALPLESSPTIPFSIRSAIPAIWICSVGNPGDSDVHAPPTDFQSTAAPANRRLVVPAPSATPIPPRRLGCSRDQGAPLQLSPVNPTTPSILSSQTDSVWLSRPCDTLLQGSIPVIPVHAVRFAAGSPRLLPNLSCRRRCCWRQWLPRNSGRTRSGIISLRVSISCLPRSGQWIGLSNRFLRNWI